MYRLAFDNGQAMFSFFNDLNTFMMFQRTKGLSLLNHISQNTPGAWLTTPSLSGDHTVLCNQKATYKKLKRIEVVPVVIGALGSVTKEFNKWIGKIGIVYNVGTMQKTALLGTARILRKVLEM